jgi:hypothetical protein
LEKAAGPSRPLLQSKVVQRDHVAACIIGRFTILGNPSALKTSAWASTGAADRTSRKSPQRGVDRIVGPEAQGRAQRVGRHLADRRRTKLDPPALDACGGEKQGFGRIEPGRDFDGHDPVRLDMSNERPRRRDIIQGRSTGRRTGRSRGSPN